MSRREEHEAGDERDGRAGGDRGKGRSPAAESASARGTTTAAAIEPPMIMPAT
jgi:hypothetical protein